MRSEKITALLMALLLLLLPAILSGCESESALSSTPETEPTPTVAAEPTPTPEPEQEATPAPEPTPGDSGVSSEADSPFRELFEANPIDAKMADALDEAFTNRAVYSAYATAEEEWRKVVEQVYPLALECLTGAEQEELQTEQEAWQAEMAEKLPAIREEAGDTEDGKIDAAAKISELYRTRALALCQIYHFGYGELPDFEAMIDGAPMG